MLVPPVALYILVGVLGVIALVFAVKAENAIERKGLLRGLAWVGGVSAVALLVGGIALSSRTYIFEGTSPSITYSEYLVFGSKTIELKTSKTKVEVKNASGDWIVNDTDGALTVTTANYGSAPIYVSPFGGGGPSYDSVSPGSAYLSSHGVQHFGPDDPLPESVSSKSSSETHVHVGW